MPLKVIVIGGVAAGPKAAAKIMRLNPGAEVTLLEKGVLLELPGRFSLDDLRGAERRQSF
jgi:NADPH-dependent 2,4-dienoyl-CoA reductase/sulfur reductase-like enzyme